ncbi:hypothetical protein BT63DRAFT_422268, partial [Microthyrium microscopicum]
MTTHSILNSKFPVNLPRFDQLLLSDVDFVEYLDGLNTKLQATRATDKVSASLSTTTLVDAPDNPQKSAFIDALHASNYRIHSKESLAEDNKMLTENADVTNISSQDALVDLFYKLNDADNCKEILESAWKVDSMATVKIIFNARSIHLGKSNRNATYKALGWLYQEHPMTFLSNLPFLVRPVISKPKKERKKENGDDAKKEGSKVKKEDDKMDLDEDDDFELVVPPEGSAFDTMAHDRKNGWAHGYWKDLLNILALAAEDKLDPNADPDDVLNIQSAFIRKKVHRSKQLDNKQREAIKNRVWDQKEAKKLREQKRDSQHAKVVKKLEEDHTYRALHLIIARLFGAQLRRDMALLNSSKDSNKVSLAAKWAPTVKESHDKITFIASSIAEYLFKPEEACPDVPATDRTVYLQHARAAYQFKVLSPLRKQLDVVERHITAGTFADIRYDHVPSLAMDRHSKLFFAKDEENFMTYLDKVSDGKATMSGAVLLPSTIIAKLLRPEATPHISKGIPKAAPIKAVQNKVLDGQWNSLVQRIRESGKLESSIAVCDVSGSMGWPTAKDGSTPMDSAIGLSLLLAEVCEPPFGGNMITFSERPAIIKVGGLSDTRTVEEKARFIQRSPWGMNTDFTAVFEKLILPLAIEHKLKQEDMVKQVFVFSDMQFDQATAGQARWSGSFERIQTAYKEAGYEMPTLIFWNLASGDKGVPVTSEEPGTALVSGYSQAQMKVFLDGGGFEDPAEEEEEEDVEVIVTKDGEDVTMETAARAVKEKKKIDPISVVRKAISHEGYAMLRVA